MKNIFSLLFLVSLFFASCDKSDLVVQDPEDCEDTMICDGDCLFTEYNTEGIIAFQQCYQTWSIAYIAENGEEWVALFPDMPTAFQVEGKEVVFSATFFENDIPFVLPDPMIFLGLHKAELCDVISLN